MVEIDYTTFFAEYYKKVKNYKIKIAAAAAKLFDKGGYVF